MINNFDSTSQEVNVFIGKRLRVRRIILGLTQTHLATAMGITFQQIQKYENGTNGASAARLLQFSRILAVPVSYFFDGLVPEDHNTDSPSPKIETAKISGLSHEQVRLLSAFHKIPSEDLRSKILKFITELSVNNA